MKPPTTLTRPVSHFLAKPGFTLHADWSIDQALQTLRSGATTGSTASPVIYFYVIDNSQKLVGVLPTRRLILAPGSKIIADIMTRELVTLRPHETLADALELFALHRLLALPVVDPSGTLLGTVEVSQYTDEVFDLTRNQQLNEVFQLIGLHLEQHRQGSPLRGFKLRMPWLLANIIGGLLCATLGALFESTLQKVVILALFIPLLLTLAESIAVQSMTLAIEQAVTTGKRKLPAMISREFLTALLLGLTSGILVGAVSLLWHGPLAATLTIATSVTATMLIAALLGRVLPKLIQSIKLDARIASGPITLAIVDIATITLYLSAATATLGN